MWGNRLGLAETGSERLYGREHKLGAVNPLTGGRERKKNSGHIMMEFKGLQTKTVEKSYFHSDLIFTV